MSSVREFAARIARLERDLSAISTAPQLGHSSLDDENVNVYDRDGNLKATVGHQHDGTYTSAELDGPIPPVPAVPTVEGGPGSLTVAWDGTYGWDRRAPLDFRLVEIWAAPEPFLGRDGATLLGHFSNEAGGELTVARPVGMWHVGLVTKAESGRRSAISSLATGTVTSMIDQAIFDELADLLDDLQIDLEELAVAFTTSEDVPTVTDGEGKPDGAYWTQIDGDGEQIGRWRWTGTEWVDAPLGAVFIPELGVSKLVADAAGFDIAVVNELFADMFTAHKITAEHADLRTFVADEGFVTSMRTNILTASSVPPDALKLGLDELLPDPMFERELQPADAPFTYSTQYRLDGQARTLKVDGGGLVAGSRFWLSDSKPAAPAERYMLQANLRTSARDYAVAVGLEVQDEAGVRLGDLVVPARAMVEQDEPGGQDPDPEDDEEEPDTEVEYPLNEYFAINGVVKVPESGFRVRPWVGLMPEDTAVAGQDWYVSQVSWRDVPTTTSKDGWVSMLTPNGLRVVTPENRDAILLGNFDDVGMSFYQTGPELDEDGNPVLDDAGEPFITEDPTVVISDEGYVGAQEMSADESFTYRGDELQDLLDDNVYDGPKGIVSHNDFEAAGGYRGPYSQETGIFYGRFMAEPGRLYKVTSSFTASASGTFIRVRLNGATSTDSYPNARISTGFAILPQYRVESPRTGDSDVGAVNTSWMWYPRFDEIRYVTLLVTGEPSSGATFRPYLSAGGYLYVEDVGPIPDDSSSSGWHRGGAPPPSGGSDPDPTPVPSKPKKYKLTWFRQWHRTWQQNGAVPGPAQKYATQGRTPYYTAAGKYRSMVGFNSMTSQLSGAEILKVRVRIKVSHSHSNTGGTVVIGTHGWLTRPASWGRTSYDVVRARFRQGQTRWITLPKSTHAGFKSGDRRGISFYANSTASKYYVQIPPASVRVEITYKK